MTRYIPAIPSVYLLHWYSSAREAHIVLSSWDGDQYLVAEKTKEGMQAIAELPWRPSLSATRDIRLDESDMYELFNFNNLVAPSIRDLFNVACLIVSTILNVTDPDIRCR